MTSIITKIDFPKAQKLSLTQINNISETLLNVAKWKADITFVEPAIALEYIEKNPWQIKEVENIEPLRIFPNTLIVWKWEVELLSTLNTAIDELINNGFVEKIIDKYEKYPNSFQKTQSPITPNRF